MLGTTHYAWLSGLTLIALCATACAGDPRPESPSPGAPTYTITLAHGRPVVVAEESLSVELTAVKDSRCPSDVRCVWAGHATVTLQVSKAGSAAESVTIGTRAPTSMNLPFEATYGRYRFGLVSLEPGNSHSAPVALSLYRATVKVTKF